MDLSKLFYAESHEWADLQGSICTVGITQYAVDQLTDVTHIQLPKVSAPVTAGKPFGEIESVKAVFDLNSPMSGEIIEVNEAVRKDPTLVSSDPYGKGWMIRIKVAQESTSHLMNLTKYNDQLAAH